MWSWLVNFLMGLLRWGIITYVAKPFVDWVIIKPISDMLLGGSPVDVIEGAIEDAIEDAIDANVGSVGSASVVINGTI